VARVFETLDIPVYYADLAAKRLMNDNEQLRSAITGLFGEKAYFHGKLNRSYIASVVFNDKEKLDQLNAIVHPVTIRDSERWMAIQTSPYAIKEAALIFESASNKNLDYVIGVYTPLELRVQRVSTRDSVSTAEVYRRIANQMQEEDKMKLCDCVIVNDEQQLVIPQVLAIHERFTANGKRQTANGIQQNTPSASDG
jgi:dephospho-CoA kinase